MSNAEAQSLLAPLLAASSQAQENSREEGQKRRRKRASTTQLAFPGGSSEYARANCMGADGAGMSLPVSSRPNLDLFQSLQLPHSMPQFPTPTAANFASAQLSGDPFLLAPVGPFQSGEVSVASTNAGPIPGNGTFAGVPPNRAAESAMLQSVMSQFALGFGAAGLFAVMPGGAQGNATGEVAASHIPCGSHQKNPARQLEPQKEHGSHGSRKAKDDKGKGTQRKLRKNVGQGSADEAAEQDDDFTTPWRCDVCNIYFTSAQALGGHRIHSTDHKQRSERLKRGDSAAQINAPRLSLHVYSNEEPAVRRKRTRLPPMLQMAGFERVLAGFPPDVREAFQRTSSPAAYFSSCSLDVFRRHDKFGDLGCRILRTYSTETSDRFEDLMQTPKALPETVQAGFGFDISDELHNELKIFARMLLTKKKALEINRRAVSKRSKGIRMAGGERLREFNQKKAYKHAGARLRRRSEGGDPDPPPATPSIATGADTPLYAPGPPAGQ